MLGLNASLRLMVLVEICYFLFRFGLGRGWLVPFSHWKNQNSAKFCEILVDFLFSLACWPDPKDRTRSLGFDRAGALNSARLCGFIGGRFRLKAALLLLPSKVVIIDRSKSVRTVCLSFSLNDCTEYLLLLVESVLYAAAYAFVIHVEYRDGNVFVFCSWLNFCTYCES